MSRKPCYADLSHPGMKETLTQHNVSTLNLAVLVAEFAQQMAAAHEKFSKEIQTVISNIKRKNSDLKKERPVDTASTIHSAWEALLLEVEMDAQAHLDVASLLLKNVYKPLDEVATHKTSQAKKLQGFRQSFEMLVTNTEDKLEKCLMDYHDSYQVFRMSNSSSMPGTREAAKISFYNAHNDYLLQLRSSNRLIEQFHLVLPQVLEELEEIHIDTSNTINVAIESHALLLLTKATEQHRRFESLLKVCTQVNPQLDISLFVKAVSPEPSRLQLSLHQFTPPPDLNLNNPEEALRTRLVLDRHTDVAIKERRSAIQKEAAELTSYIKQNQDVTQTLVNICQRNLANHLYEKVYETQEDLCRKRNEIRLANMQLAAVRAQVDMLTPKQNGTVESVDQDSKKASSASIKGMWKKAFKTLKSTEEKPEKDKEKEKDKGKGSGSLIKRSSFTRLRKDSKEKDDVAEGEQEVSHEIDPVYSLLKCAADLPKAGSSGKPCTNTGCSGHKHGVECGGNASQSSSPSSSASDTPRNWRKKLNARMKSFSLDTPDYPKQLLGIDETTKKKSHSFTNTCVPVSETPKNWRKKLNSRFKSFSVDAYDHSMKSLTFDEVRKKSTFSNNCLASHSPKTRRKKLNARMKSFSLDTQEPPKQLLAIDETTKKKSSSFTNTCLGEQNGGSPTGNALFRFLSITGRAKALWSQAPSSPTDSSSSQATNRKKLGKRSSSLEIEESKHRSHSPSPRDSPITLSPRSQKKLEKQKEIYVVLYHFRGKEKDDLDLRAGWRISVLDSSDPDWWKGRHNNKMGYFPATYVIRLNPGQRVFQVTHAMHLSEGDNGLRLHKDQIVIQAGEEEHGMILVMAANKKQAMCPLKYLQEV